jgi:hypothetical protein
MASSSRFAAMSFTMLAPAANAARATAGFIVSIESGTWVRATSPSMTGMTRFNSSGFTYRQSARARGFTPDVEDGRALLGQIKAVRHRRVRIAKLAAIGKRIRRHVHDAHDERRARETEFKLAAAE